MRKKRKVLYSRDQAGEALGEISVRAVDALIAAGVLKSIRVGRRRLIPFESLQAFIRRNHATVSLSGKAAKTNATSRSERKAE